MPETSETRRRLRFGAFELDVATGELRKQGFRIAFQEQPFRVLTILLAHPGEVVTREELRQCVWPGHNCGDFDHGLNTAVSKIREALGDSATHPRFVETVARRGYRFVAPVEAAPMASVHEPAESALSEEKPGVAACPIPTKLVLPGGKHTMMLVVISLSVISGTAYWLLHYQSAPSKHVSRLPASLVVLPFTDLSPQKDQEYFCDGLTEDLINGLSKLDGVRVIARTSSFRLKGQTANEDARRIGAQLGVNTILEGTVRKVGDRLRITTELIDAESGYQLWSESYDRDVGKVFEIQEQTAQAVVDALRIKLTPGPSTPLIKRATGNLAAYNLYLQGRYLWNKRTEEDLEKAIQCFREATIKDPHSAAAFAGLADSYAVLQNWGERAPIDVWPQAREAAQKALEVDDTLADAHLSLGHVKSLSDHDWEGAAREFRRALALDPKSANAHHWYAALYLDPQGRLDESLAELWRAAELDPLAPIILAQMGEVLRWKGRDAEAIEQFDKALRLEPNSVFVYEERALVHLAHARPEEARRDLERAHALAPRRSLTIARMVSCEVALRRSEAAARLLGELQRRAQLRYVSPYALAVAYVGLGRTEQALTWLGRAVDEREAKVISIGVDPVFGCLHEDTGFTALLQRMHLPLTAVSVR
jgi:TolB-like protein/DNA-binding winged helix-turn-helix (wHTH) protein/Tfp pilus assembly protein PilF